MIRQTIQALFLLICMSGLCAHADTERTREGGLATIKSDQVLVLQAESSVVIFDHYSERKVPQAGKTRIFAEGSETFSFFKKLYERYSVSEPDQLVHVMGRQIIYGAGVTCVRKPDFNQPGALENIYEPKPYDKYWCEFLMDLHTGKTQATGVAEFRGRFGVSNGRNN